MSKAFHITITDNKAGTIELDMDTDCIIGAVDVCNSEGKDGTIELGYTDCSGANLVSTAAGAIAASKAVTENRPALRVLFLMALAKSLEGGQKE